MIIYMTTNLVNGKKYIGRDSKNNPKYIGSGRLLKKAIKKYGKSSFKKEILEVCSSYEELIKREEYWLNYYDVGNNPIFYNANNCSNGGPLFFGRKHIEVTRKKMSESRRGEGNVMWGKQHSQETRIKISENLIGKMSGEKNPMYGKRGKDSPAFGRKHTQDTKRKIGEKLKGRIFTEETKSRISKTRIERSISKGENNPNFKGYSVCIVGDYIGQRKTATEWGKILNMDSSGFRLHLYGKRYKKGIKGNFFKWEHEIK
jgi:group I intron endonuclease